MTESAPVEEAPQSDLQKKIATQVEYYFGDINLPRDKFIQEEMKKDEGWIPLETMLKFNRLSNITKDIDEIAKALKNSSLIEVSDNNEKIRRNPELPLPDNTLEYWQEIKRRTVYVKGFPLDTPLDEILEFVGKFGTVKNVLMRRTKPGRVFKGSIFATFTDRETAEKFVKNEETKQFKGNDLTKLMQDEYWVRKTKETKERRLAEKSVKSTMKQQAVEEQKKSALGSHFIKGLVLNVHGLPKEGKATVNKLKEFFNQFSEVAYVVYEENQDDAQIRFKSATENAAMEAWEKALAKHNGEVLFEGAKITAELLSGEEEEKYWADFTKQKVVKDNRKQNARFGNRRGGGRGGGGGRNNKRRGDENDDDKAKKSKRTVFKDEEENAAPKEEAVKEEA